MSTDRSHRHACLSCVVIGVLMGVGTVRAQTSAAPPPRVIAPPADAHRTPIQRPETSHSPAPIVRHPASPWGTLVVLGGIVFAVVGVGQWLKRAAPQRFGGLSTAAVDLLGSCPVTQQSAIHVIRIGDRVLVVGSGPDGLRSLMEVTDPAEATQLMHLCRVPAESRTEWNPLSLLGGRRARGPVDGVTASTRTSAAADSTSQDDSRLHATEAALGDLAVRSAARTAAWLIALALFSSTLLAQPTVGQNPTRLDDPGQFNSPPAGIPNTVVTPSQLVPMWTGEPPAQLLPRSTGTSPVQPVSTTPVVSAGRQPALVEQFLTSQGLGSSLRLGLVVGALSLAPAILLMTTCYVRIVIVLGLLRQAIGAPQFPPTQVLTALSLFLTALVMWPTWERCYREGVEPYAAAAGIGGGSEADLQLALTRTAGPLRRFMSRQIETTGNTDAIDLLMSYHAQGDAPPQATYYDEIPTQVLLPAYVLSELKTAFLIGFQVYLPFVVIDLVVTSVLASLGLGTLAPAVVSLPLKLLLFVMIDGWFLVVETLLRGLNGG